MAQPESVPETDSRPTMTDLEEKFVMKGVCTAEMADVATAVDIGEMKETMASMAKWMELHHETHAGGLKKTQTIAVVISTVVASLSLLCSSIIAILAILKYI